MKEKTDGESWIIDQPTFEKIQTLKEYVDFVSGLEFCPREHKLKADEINFLIENLNNPHTFKNWMVGLDIYDFDVQSRLSDGIYWRKWLVIFEDNTLEIEAESCHSDELGYSTDFYHYHGFVEFDRKIYGKRKHFDAPIADFIKDAKNYKKYITKTLNELETDIDIW